MAPTRDAPCFDSRGRQNSICVLLIIVRLNQCYWPFMTAGISETQISTKFSRNFSDACWCSSHPAKSSPKAMITVLFPSAEGSNNRWCCFRPGMSSCLPHLLSRLATGSNRSQRPIKHRNGRPNGGNNEFPGKDHQYSQQRFLIHAQQIMIKDSATFTLAAKKINNLQISQRGRKMWPPLIKALQITMELSGIGLSLLGWITVPPFHPPLIQAPTPIHESCCTQATARLTIFGQGYFFITKKWYNGATWHTLTQVCQYFRQSVQIFLN